MSISVIGSSVPRSNGNVSGSVSLSILPDLEATTSGPCRELPGWACSMAFQSIAVMMMQSLPCTKAPDKILRTECSESFEPLSHD